MKFKKNGFKTSWFGGKFWIIYHHFAYCNRTIDPELQKLFYTLPQHLLPCIFCRESYQEFLVRPENNLDLFVKKGEVPEWTWRIHNLVNDKLEKPRVDYKRCSKVYRNLKPQEWLEPFWIFVFTIALNYPANFQFTETGNPRVLKGKVRRSITQLTEEERARYKAYLLFYDNLASFMPDGDFVCKWMEAYTKTPISRLSLCSREHLVRWLHTLAYDTGLWDRSLIDTIGFIEANRAQSCDKTKKTCA